VLERDVASIDDHQKSVVESTVCRLHSVSSPEERGKIRYNIQSPLCYVDKIGWADEGRVQLLACACHGAGNLGR
jgi:hypothetical protein